MFASIVPISGVKNTVLSMVTLPVPVPVPVAVKNVPGLLSAAPIAIKSVGSSSVPVVTILYSTPTIISSALIIAPESICVDTINSLAFSISLT